MKGKGTSPHSGCIKNQKESFRQTLGKKILFFNYSKQNHVDGRLYILL